MIKDIILIDDDTDDLFFLRDAIQKTHMQSHCRTFDDPCEAIAYIEALPKITVELIVIDFSMPKMNGLECLQRLVQLPRARDVRFIVYSGSDLPTDIQKEIVALGGVTIKKPSSYVDFTKLVKKLLAPR